VGGFGGYEKGWSAQVENLTIGLRHGSRPKRVTGRVENISQVVAPELAYSVDIERTKMRPANAQEFRSMALRVISIFRLEDGHWELLDRHADSLVDKQ
jgi:hypothetical protein